MLHLDIYALSPSISAENVISLFSWSSSDLQSLLVYVLLLHGWFNSQTGHCHCFIVFLCRQTWCTEHVQIVCTTVEHCVPLRILDYRGRASHLSHLSPELTPNCPPKKNKWLKVTSTDVYLTGGLTDKACQRLCSLPVSHQQPPSFPDLHK